MFPVRARRAAGFTMIEAMVALAIFGILLAVGIPSMSSWMMANKVRAASEFYMEGFRTARQQAIAHNAASRIVLSANQTTGQMDWQVDICFPTAAAPCEKTSANWSTASTMAPGDPDPSTPFKSLRRSADILPSDKVIAPTLFPLGASAVYYNGLGWVNTGLGNNLTQLRLDPRPAYVSQLPTSAISITLAGMPNRCDVEAVLPDSRACPPTGP